MKQDQLKQPLCTEADREQQARAWTDRMPDDGETEAGPARETYRDGSLISECWAEGKT